MAKYLSFLTKTRDLSTMKRPTPYPGRQGEITDTGSGPCSAIAPTCAAFPEHRKSPDTEAEHVRSILQISTFIYIIYRRENIPYPCPRFSSSTFPAVAGRSKPTSSPDGRQASTMPGVTLETTGRPPTPADNRVPARRPAAHRYGTAGHSPSNQAVTLRLLLAVTSFPLSRPQEVVAAWHLPPHIDMFPTAAQPEAATSTVKALHGNGEKAPVRFHASKS